MTDQPRLFREEFTRSAADGYGSVSVPPQRAVAIAAVCFVLAFVALAGILSSLSYTRSESARGLLVIDSSRAAVSSVFASSVEVTALYVRAGQQIVPGAPIASVRAKNLATSSELQGISNSFPSYGAPSAGGAVQTATLLSTQSGYVEKVLVAGGQHVSAGQPIAVIASNPNRIKVAVLLSSRAVGLVEPLMEVHIRLDSFPYQRFGSIKGQVSAISQGSLSPDELSKIFGIAPPADNMFVVDVWLTDRRTVALELDLRPGMTATVDFPVEKRSMLKWIFSAKRMRT